MNKLRNLIVAVWPFTEYPDKVFFIARNDLDSNGRALEQYFFESEHPLARCTFEEAQIIVARWRTRFPGRKCKTYSLTELRKNPKYSPFNQDLVKIQ